MRTIHLSLSNYLNLVVYPNTISSRYKFLDAIIEDSVLHLFFSEKDNHSTTWGRPVAELEDTLDLIRLAPVGAEIPDKAEILKVLRTPEWAYLIRYR